MKEKEHPPTPRQLDILTYPRLLLCDHTLDDNLPAFESQLLHSQFRPSLVNVGGLDRLPLELLQEILSQLDLLTLVDFRRVNKRATELVDVLPCYKAITTNARNALRGALSIGSAKWITCRDLYEQLCTPRCENCGDFGGYLYLFTCKRVCFLCFSQENPYLPMTPNHAGRKFGLDRCTLETLPRIKAIPGIYSPNEKKVAQSTFLVDYGCALRAGVASHGSLAAMHKYVSDREAATLRAYTAKLAQAQQPGSSRRVRRPPATDPVDMRSGNPFRFVAIVRAPWLNRAAREVVWGFHCVGCEKSSRPPLHYRRKFTAASFEDHLKQCGDIQNRKHHLS